MPVTDTHPNYDNIKTTWKKMRDCAVGQLAIHSAGQTYLPSLDGQTVKQYEAYKTRALFLAATSRTIDSLVGTVFRKPPEIEVPPAMEEWLDDISASGVSIDQLCRNGMEEMLTPGRLGLLVDYPLISDDELLTAAQVSAQGIRPRIKMYSAENVINWNTETRGNHEVLSLVVLKETVEDPIDEFDTTNTKDQYRVLDLNEGRYRQRVFGENNQVILEVEPTMGGQPLDFIPFIIANSYGEGENVDMPPLNDLADINVSHYQAYADYRHGLHYTGLPTAVVSGLSADDAKGGLSIGSSDAWLLERPEAKAYFLEFEGKGLETYKEELDSLETNMAIFGARLLRESKKTAEAAETASINRSGETSLLASWAAVVGEAIQHALELARDWAGLTGDVSVQLNKDYTPTAMTAQDLTALVNALQGGHISYETFWLNLQRGEVAPESRGAEEERDLIEMDGPVGLGGLEVDNEAE